MFSTLETSFAFVRRREENIDSFHEHSSGRWLSNPSQRHQLVSYTVQFKGIGDSEEENKDDM